MLLWYDLQHIHSLENKLPSISSYAKFRVTNRRAERWTGCHPISHVLIMKTPYELQLKPIQLLTDSTEFFTQRCISSGCTVDFNYFFLLDMRIRPLYYSNTDESIKLFGCYIFDNYPYIGEFTRAFSLKPAFHS